MEISKDTSLSKINKLINDGRRTGTKHLSDSERVYILDVAKIFHVSDTERFLELYLIAERIVQSFEKDIINKERIPRNEEHRIFDIINICDDGIAVEMLPSLLKAYRARNFEGIDEKSYKRDFGFWGYNVKDSFVPEAKASKNMRANFKNIPYLYCAQTPYIACTELRPRFGSTISVATIQLNKELKMFNFSARIYSEPDKYFSQYNDSTKFCVLVLYHIGKLFSKPATTDDDPLEYFPTQYLADYVKKLGFDGIIYDSVFSKKGVNYCIFNFSKCEVIASNLLSVEESFISLVKKDNADSKLMLGSDISDKLEIIAKRIHNIDTEEYTLSEILDKIKELIG